MHPAVRLRQIDTGKPQPLDEGEPRRVAESVAAMGLKYATVNGVARDDQPDGGAWLYAQTCREFTPRSPVAGWNFTSPTSTPNRTAGGGLLGRAGGSRAQHRDRAADFRRIRPGFGTRGRWRCCGPRARPGFTKSNLILGLGEERHEITEAMWDLRAAGCDLLTITQYLRPTPRHHPVERWVKPEEFVELREEALGLGFAGVMSGPLVRSSYRAGRLYTQAIEQRADAAGTR